MGTWATSDGGLCPIDLLRTPTRGTMRNRAPGEPELATLKSRLRSQIAELTGPLRVLVVLQGGDASGKDGLIQELGLDPQPGGRVRIARFKAPTAAERRYDFLWRIHQQVPAAGELVVFNRSHYEDLVEPLLAASLSTEMWRRRCEHVNSFEEMLVDEGVVVVKAFLHVSQAVQAERLQRHRADPILHHLVNPEDDGRNRRWRAYAQAYSEAINRTTTPHAPWTVIPADEPLERNTKACRLVVERLARAREQGLSRVLGLDSRGLPARPLRPPGPPK